MKDFLTKPKVKTGILAILPIIIGVLSSAICTKIDVHLVTFWIKLVGLAVISILYIGLLVWYSTHEVNDRRVLEERQKELTAMQATISNINTICLTTTAEINLCIHRFIDTGKPDPNVWSFEKVCQQLCTYVYQNVSILGNGSKDFEVSYIRLCEDRSPAEVCMTGFANEAMHQPRTYQQNRRIDKKDGQTYYDIELFQMNRPDIQVLANREEINNAFAYLEKDSRAKNHDKYHQYIGIPVFCDNKKMVGLLQIACLHEAQLGLNKRELEEVAKKFLLVYSHFYLLFHKMEKALLAEPKAQSEDQPDT